MSKTKEVEEVLSILDLREEQTLEEIQESPKEKRKNRYVFIKHNATEGYADKNKVGEYGKDLFPGFRFDIEVAALDRSGKNLFLTGLDESLYKEKYEKEFLEESIVILKKNFGPEVLDPFNQTFWSNSSRNLKIDQDEIIMDLEDPDSLLKYWTIKGGGYPIVAKSPEDLNIKNSRFYLEEPHISYDLGENVEKLRDKAIRLLSEIDESGHSRKTMFTIHKLLITPQEGITEATPKSIIYNALRRYIAGDYSETQKKKAPKMFIDAVTLYRTNIKKAEVIALVNDGIWYAIFTTDKDNYYKNQETGYNFKTTDKDKVVEELCKVSNQDELLSIMRQVQLKWNKY